VKALLEDGTKKAVELWKEGRIRPIRVSKPVDVKLRFLSTGFADVAELCPIIRRIDGKTVEFEAESVEEAYKMLELLVFASTGVRKIIG
jgi:D-amino peptidase